MNAVIATVVVHFLVSAIADKAGALVPADLKKEVNAKVEASISSKFLDVTIESIADPIVDAVCQVLKDQDGLSAALKALASQDMPAAKAALLALLKPVVTGNLALVLAAVA